MKKFFFLSLMALMVAVTMNAKVAYLLTESTISALPEEEGQKPEQNAANWFKATYVDQNVGQFVSLSDLASGLSSDIKVLWINIDRTDLADLAAAGIDAAAVANVKAFVEAGGSLLLTKQAVHLTSAMDRISYAPSWSNVGYHDGGDIWYIKTKLGLGTANPTDRSTHAIYAGLTMDENGQFPLVGPVRRSDRNNQWNDYLRKEPLAEGQETHYDNGNVLRLQEFEADWNCEALATWPHIQDYCLPMIINFKPQDNFKGSILNICLAAYQWGTANEDATNGYIANVRKLTQNSIEYLYGSDPLDGATAIDNTAAGTKAVKTFLNGQLVIEKNGKTYNALGAEIR